MKNILLFTVTIFVFCAINPNNSLGQIVLVQTDLPDTGDIQIMMRVDTAQAASSTPGSSGTNISWDFSSLNPDGRIDTFSHVDPSTTPYASDFPSANIATERWKPGNSCYRYAYSIKGSSGMQSIGAESCADTLLLPGNYLSFPLLAFGDSVNHFFRFVYDSIDPNNYKVFYVGFVSKADAWGTIITPADTVPTLRIYTTETLYDSSYVSGSGTQNSLTTGGYYYFWYAKDLGWPVMQLGQSIVMEPNRQEVWYASDLSSVPTGINYNFSENNFSVYPNPFSVYTTIQSNVEFKNATLTLYNILGQVIKTDHNISGDRITLFRGNLSSGLYFYQLIQDDHKPLSGKLMIE